MSATTPPHEYLVLSHGQWDRVATPAQIQQAIELFYAWHDRLVAEGRMRPGQRLEAQGKMVSRERVLDGPFSESKEWIGGYWFILASSLDEAAAIAAGNPCLAMGLRNEIRPIEAARASAYVSSCERPGT